jgi:hypothetical protein
MRLQDIFDQLSTSEFSQISLGGQDAGVINEANQELVLNHINMALTAIYKRFNLREGRVRFVLQPGADSYAIKAEDLLKIERVVTDGGEELTLNDHNDPYSCFTPSLNSIRLPKAIVAQDSSTPDVYKTEGLTVIYRANHKKISSKYGFLNPTTMQLDLPQSHLMALLYYIASRAHNPIGMGQEFNAGNTWYMKFLSECEDLENRGLQVQETEEANRLKRNGWV